MAALQHFVNDFDRKNCYLLDYKVLSGMFKWVYGFLPDTGAIGCTVTAHRLTTRPYTDFFTTFQSGPTPRRGHRFYRKNRDQVLPRGAYPNILGNSGARYRKRQTRVSDTQITQDKEGAQGIQNEGYFLYQNERNFPREDTHPPYRKQEFRFA